MARSTNDSDRDFPAHPEAHDIEDPARIIAQSAVLEPFDGVARARFGRIISLVVTRQKHR
jgi:hypothetical protein